VIHPTAVVHPGARVEASAQIGPYAVIDEHVSLGAECVVGPHVVLTGHTVIGARNRFHAGCVIGDAPQDHKYKGEPTRLVVGDDNVFREHVTVHRSNKMEEDTVVGSHNFLMANSHVAHNARIGAHVILANGALLAGHVEIGDRAFISGNCIIHQFTRVGTLALMQGGAAASQDVPPYCLASGLNGLYGLNAVGLRRAGFDADQRMELQRLYRALFRSGMDMGTALRAARAAFSSPAALAMLDFIASSKRGVCRHAHHATPQREVEA
jgi:UDP-N-acetylglucosamine acyltransferase